MNPTEITVNGKGVPVIFSMRDIAVYMHNEKVQMDQMANLDLYHLQNLFWLAVQKGQSKAKETVFATEEQFFDALDQDFQAIGHFSNAFADSLGMGRAEQTEEAEQAEQEEGFDPN